VYTTSDVKQAMYHYEHPLDYGSFIPNYLLFKEATNSMVLTGDGADELFGGYERAQLEDTFMFDIMELQYYHNIRLDRMSMAWTKEARSPLMSMPLARIARRLGKHLRTNKHILRQLYKDKLPTTVTTQKKKPLRLYNDKEQNIARCKEIFYKVWLQNQES
jgi:asparagine synthetase B (glutamine-hydrolysing)